MSDPKTVTIPRRTLWLIVILSTVAVLTRCMVTNASSDTEHVSTVTSTVTIPASPSKITDTVTLNTAICDGQG